MLDLSFRPVDMNDEADVALSLQHWEDARAFNKAETGRVPVKGHMLPWYYPCFIMNGDKVVGEIDYIDTNEQFKKLASSPVRMAYISLVYIAPEYRQQRLGLKSVTQMECMLAGEGYDAAYLHSFVHNLEAAGLYDRLGWKHDGDEQGRYKWVKWFAPREDVSGKQGLGNA